ncbi:dihydrodipicolinate synthase family protein [Roseovarius mucosus]|uniref:dihydrodipicolinate synthase family protein n=1 Tax=Roseovarius mucosus TaxID=215743 RepID=UPI003F70C6F0
MKTTDEARERTHGLFNITVTSFAADGSIDFAGISETVERVLGMGFDGLLIGGTYGEFPVMTVDERLELFGHVMDVVGDRAPVLLCTAHSDPRVVRDLTQRAGEMGGLPMVTAPYVTEITENQIEAFFHEVAPLSRTGIMVYNAPGIGITLSPGLIERLCDIVGVVALKQGDLSPATVDRLAASVCGRIRVLAASDLVFPGAIVAGFDGFSSTNSCALPEIIQQTWVALGRGDLTEATRLHRAWYPFRALARNLGQPQTTKAAMRLRGWAGGRVRPPLLELDPAETAKLREVLAAIGAATGHTLLAEN